MPVAMYITRSQVEKLLLDYLKLDGSNAMTGDFNCRNIFPTTHDTYDIGSLTKRIKTLYCYYFRATAFAYHCIPAVDDNYEFGTLAKAWKHSVLYALGLKPSSAPASPIEGDVYYDSTAKKLKVYNGTDWEEISSV